jgi:hypothetical protein
MRAIRPTRAEDVVNTLVDYPEVWVWLPAVVSTTILRASRPTKAEDVVNTLVAYPEVWVWLLALVSIFFQVYRIFIRIH